MRKVLLAGATGHLGLEVLSALKVRGYWVRALVRDPGKANAVQQLADEVFLGDLTQPGTLAGCCDGIEVVISSAGLTVSAKRQKDRASFTAVDYQGNRNLLDVAVAVPVQKFVYVSVFGHQEFGHLEYVRAHEELAQELQLSGCGYTIIRPTADFSVFRDLYLPSPNPGRAIVLGDGAKRINPIHEADLAGVCVDAVTGGAKEIDVGGPKAYTRREIAELAFAAAGKPSKLVKRPLRLASVLGIAMRPLDQRLSAMFAFGIATSKVDCLAPMAGSRTLESYYAEVASQFHRQA